MRVSMRGLTVWVIPHGDGARPDGGAATGVHAVGCLAVTAFVVVLMVEKLGPASCAARGSISI
jgi:hypothetical protein